MESQIRDKPMNAEESNDLLKPGEKDETNKIILPQSTRIGIYHQIMVTVFVTPIMISLAHVLSYPALILPQLRNENDTLYLDQEDGSWYTSVYSLTSPIGSLTAGIMMDRYGRKIALATPLIPMIVTWIVTATAKTHATLFISRVFLGIFGGFAPPICLIFLAECADSEFRGIIINVGYVSLSAGFLLTFALGAVMDWRLLAWTGTVFPIITLIGLTILPESPIWLIRHGHIDRAYKNLLWLRGDANIARNELNVNLSRISQENAMAEETNSRSARDFLQPAVLKPIVIIFSFILLFNLTGTYLIIYYALDILSQVNLAMSVEKVSVILSVVRLVVTVGFCWLFMKVNRRSTYLIAGVGSTLSTLILACILGKQKIFTSNSTWDLWISASLLLLYVATNTGFMITPGFLTGELLPAKIRGRLAGYIYTYFSIVTFLLNKFFPQLNQFIGMTGVFIVFGVASLATTCLIYFMVPETKGKSLLEIERHFQTNGWIYKSNSVSESSDN